MLKEFISGKTDVALKFPKHSASGEDPSIQLELRAGHVISFSEDIEVLELTRDAMIKPKSKSARSTKILHSTPKSQVAPKAFASVSYAKKSLPPTVGNTSNSEPIDNNKRKTTKTNPSRSKDQAIKPTADEVSDLGVCALQSSESEESDSGNEEEDWLAPSPPPRTHNKIPRTDVDRCIGGSASSNGAVHSVVHRNEIIRTPPVSRCNTPSSFRTPSREEFSKDLQSLNNEASHLDDSNCNEEKSQEAQIIGQSNSLQNIEEENYFFKEQLNQSLIDYEHMKAEYERKLHEKEELIKS
ncbi:uncharacterized protein LOC124341819 [Daphnia pulicaria]|uniref:uncharacterized protein LOC124341819 n=1 Tax=Daphnia pulicaria TaxID=35523 RepID=UPI001EEAEFF3|nr:uncharacterized protein LOC124341819 [Daphnia pulicaria]